MEKQTIISFKTCLRPLLISGLIIFLNYGYASDRKFHTGIMCNNNSIMMVLTDSLTSVINTYPGEIGVAMIYDNRDTVVINNATKYPLMSVFKLHQAISTCDYLFRNNIDMDSIISIQRNDMNPDTWSPMLKDNIHDTITLSYRQLLNYALKKSDNNASNYLFKHTADINETDTLLLKYIPRQSFSIRYTEDDMYENHQLAYDNVTSPLGCAVLINKLYTDSVLSKAPYSDFIRNALENCETGTDRIIAPLINESGIRIGHKTGSGFSENGILSAHNDIAYICLPDDHHYTLSIFIKDFKGSETDASAIMAQLSILIYKSLTSLKLFQ